MASTAGLDERFKPIADWWYGLLHSYDPRFVITSGLRTWGEQQDLYNRFVRGEGGVYTVMPPGRSQHERGLAVDIARLGVKARDPVTGEPDPVLVEAGLLWRSLGGVWGGEKDPVHFEAPKAWTGRS